MMMMGETSGTAFPSMSLSWITLAAIVVIGIFSLSMLWMGFRAFGSEHPEYSTYYIFIGTAGFAAIGYMFFRTKAVSTARKPDVPKVGVVSVLECPSCELKRVRDFKRGDYVYKDDEPCTRCEGTMLITDIHRRPEPEKKTRRL